MACRAHKITGQQAHSHPFSNQLIGEHSDNLYRTPCVRAMQWLSRFGLRSERDHSIECVESNQQTIDFSFRVKVAPDIDIGNGIGREALSEQ